MKSKLKGLLTYVLLPLAAFQLGLAPVKTELVKTNSLDKKITRILNVYEEHKIRDFRYKEDSELPKDVLETEITVHGQRVKIKVPGFESLSCNKCHSTKDIADSMENKLNKGVNLIKEHYDDTLDTESLIPEEMNILPFLDKDATLPSDALAEAHLSMRRIDIPLLTLLFEKLFLNDSATAHEMLHMSQKIGGYLLEQDTYFVNGTQNSTHAVENVYMNPTYKDIIANFFDPEIPKYFEEAEKAPLADKRLEEYSRKHYFFEYIKNINPETDEKIKQSIKQLKPLFIEALKERRTHRLEWGFLFRAYGIENIGLDIIAAKNYEPVTKIDPKKLEEGLELLAEMATYDFLDEPLGKFYRDMYFGMGFKDGCQRILEEKGFTYEESLNVYFTYLKTEFVTEEGKVNYEKIRQGIEENPEFIDEIVYRLEEFLKSPGLNKKGEGRINAELQKMKELLPPDYKRVRDFGGFGEDYEEEGFDIEFY